MDIESIVCFTSTRITSEPELQFRLSLASVTTVFISISLDRGSHLSFFFFFVMFLLKIAHGILQDCEIFH